MSTGAWIVIIAVALALVVGTWRLATDGRFRGTRAVGRRGEAGVEAATDDGATSAAGAALVADLGQRLGERATLLQFSSAFCAPCRATRRVLDEVTGLVEGVAHVEVDAEAHLDATRTLGIVRTPTTIVLGPDGVEVTRATGAPTRDQVLSSLARL